MATIYMVQLDPFGKWRVLTEKRVVDNPHNVQITNPDQN